MADRLDARAGTRHAPPTSRVRDLLRSILDIAKTYAPPEETARVTDATDESGGDADPQGAAKGTRPATREDMLHDLSRIAAYFRRAEPLSPLAYTLEEAVRRARLTWPELLEEVVPDNGTRSAILVMFGIRPPPAGKN